MAAREVAVGDNQRLAELVGRDASARGEIGAHRVGDIGPEKDQPIVVLPMHEQRPAVAVDLNAHLGNGGGRSQG